MEIHHFAFVKYPKYAKRKAYDQFHLFGISIITAFAPFDRHSDA